MPFSTPVTTNPVQKDDNDSRKATVLAELASLNKAVEVAQAVLDGFTLDQDAIQSAKEILADLDASIVSKTAQRQELQLQVDQLRELTAVLTQRQQDVSALDARIASLRTHETETRDLLSKAERELKAFLENSTSERAAQTAESKRLSELLKSLQEDLLVIVQHLARTRAESDEVAQTLTANRNALGSVQNELASLRSEKGLLQADISRLQTVQAEITQEHKAALAEATAQHNATFEAKKQELDQREGSLSEREAWLADKTTQLRDNKLELEKHFNRKLNITI